MFKRPHSVDWGESNNKNDLICQVFLGKVLMWTSQSKPQSHFRGPYHNLGDTTQTGHWLGWIIRRLFMEYDMTQAMMIFSPSLCLLPSNTLCKRFLCYLLPVVSTNLMVLDDCGQHWDLDMVLVLLFLSCLSSVYIWIPIFGQAEWQQFQRGASGNFKGWILWLRLSLQPVLLN